MLGSCSDRSRIVNDVSAVLVTFVSHFGRSFFVAGAVFGEVGSLTPVAPRIVYSVSNLTGIHDECDFSWQTQFLARLDNNTCCSAHCKTRINDEGNFSWQAQYLW